MEFFLSLKVSVPLIQIAMLLTLSTLALLFRRVKLALMINYIFALFWGYILSENFNIINGINEMDLKNVFIYFGFGFLVIILALVGFFQSRD